MKNYSDYTFDNQLIQAYFDGDDSYVPQGELIYLHTHPLVKPNFLVQLEQMILDCGKFIKARNITGFPIEELERLGIKLGQLLPNVTYDNAAQVMGVMRELYVLCKNIGKVSI